MIDQMIGRLRSKKTFESAIQIILDDVIALHGAEFGIVQLPIGEELVLVAQRGFAETFLQAFRRVGKNDGSISGRALRLGAPIVIYDVLEDDDYIAFRAYAVKAGYRGVQSTPFFKKKPRLVRRCVDIIRFAARADPDRNEYSEDLQRNSGRICL